MIKKILPSAIFKYLFNSLQWRLVVIFITISFSVLLFAGVYLNFQVEASYYNNFKEGIEEGFRLWNNVRGLDINNMENISIETVKNQLNPEFDKSFGRDSTYIFSLTNEYRTYTILKNDTPIEIEYSTHKNFNKNNPGIYLNEILKSQNLLSAMEGETGDKDILTDTNKDDGMFFDYAKPFKTIEGNYILYFRYDSGEWIGAINNFKNVILRSMLIAVLASLILGYILSRTITLQLKKLMNNAKGIAHGEFNQLIEVKSNDEIGELTKAFNYMAGKLKNTMEEISSEKNKNETILNYLTDGVIAFSIRGEMIHVNPVARDFLGEEGIGDTFDYFTNKHILDISLKDILEGNDEAKKTFNFTIKDKFLKVQFAVIFDDEKKPEGIIVVLHDITEQYKLDILRREFVANVSHELKTPITSIKSYSETLMDGALEDKKTTEKFLRVINKEADRMTRLVKDLLQLSSVDKEDEKWKKEKISFVDLVINSVEKVEIEAKINKQEIITEINENIEMIFADYDKIEQVVINILINAIKYTPEGGIIKVSVGEEYEEVYLKVEDNGIGIPEKDLPRIFERFYRVDKARSRKMGGTGLGLSIAREIVEYHGGNIIVKSQPDKGTEVTIKLPMSQQNVKQFFAKKNNVFEKQKTGT